MWARGQPTFREARKVLEAHCLEAGVFAGDSADRFFLIWRRLERYAISSGVEAVGNVDAGLVRSFVEARTPAGTEASLATKHLRRSAVRTFFRLLRELGFCGVDPTLDLGLPARHYGAVRPLSDEEVERGRWASLAGGGGSRHPVIWALAEAGAATAEIAEVAVDDVDGVRVRLSGGAKYRPRTVPLTSWGATQLARGIRSGGGVRVAFRDGTAPRSRPTLVAASLQATLRGVGLGEDPTVGVGSVRAWAGRRVLEETGRIEDVALRLGVRSLDAAAELIGHAWAPDVKLPG